jgi:hypothetical protein
MAFWLAVGVRANKGGYIGYEDGRKPVKNRGEASHNRTLLLYNRTKTQVMSEDNGDAERRRAS